jgi:hypothetical protein
MVFLKLHQSGNMIFEKQKQFVLDVLINFWIFEFVIVFVSQLLTIFTAMDKDMQ